MNRHQAKPVKTITFEDHFQDFLEWDLAADGRVVGCRPCQAWHWCDATVLNHAELRKGDRVYIRIQGRELSIKYPLAKVGKPKSPEHLSNAVLNSKVVKRAAELLLSDYKARKATT